MAHVNDPQELLTLAFCRSTGEGEEIHPETASEAGFGVPVFFTNGLYEKLDPDPVTSSYGISRQQNIFDTLRLLRRLSESSDEQTIVFDTAVPSWDPRSMGFEASDLKLAATIFIAKDSPFVIICEYDEVKDILEGKGESLLT